MNKTIVVGLLMLCVLFLHTACQSNNSYAKSLEREKELMADFIARNQLNILPEIPADGKWGAKDYVQIDDYLYFHLTFVGDLASGDVVATGDEVNIRYRKYTLEVDADTISYWTTIESPQPVTFKYNISSANACTAWHKAIQYMKYNNSQATILCPSKLGFSEDQTTVTPYGYDLKLQLKKY